MWFLNIEFKHFTDEIYAILFALQILSLIGDKTYNIDSSVSKFLGRISYGIYMYHWIIILIIINYIPFNDSPLLNSIKLYGIVITLTIMVSWLSYNLFEKRFLKLKQKYRIKATNKT